MEEHVPDGKTLCIHSVVVDSDYRKKGYGKFMLKEYMKYVQENSAKFGINKMLLISKIHLVHVFYEACGFHASSKNGHSSMVKTIGMSVSMIYKKLKKVC